ncbi:MULTISPECIES: hypothetical protein [unclassified Variovorax]|uniref:hypothetical protein n=1 Tax=unclassified Variovorax TaxID=663243 RepID=UPI00076BF46E|nr:MULTISPECIES: hypothetical protein [unclassified Variovorax]KWT94678.1 Conjugative transfer protein TrbL [Variovorax sp. WDL1]PNG53183.1 hypothetical protein CHC06_04528 [Variovorax sp. B2]PNG53755.1 hypothetical protein CHC07_03575 [Variovorax sp. B4]VTV11207.1 hypothetical protein WDL1CHR_02089 [Variovorax sp. WDL1]
MAITYQVVKVTGSGVTGITSSGIVTSGAPAITVSSSSDSGITINTPTDSKSNAYGTAKANLTQGGTRLAVWEKDSAATGSGHTVNITYSGSTYPVAFVVVAKGAAAAAYDASSLNAGVSGSGNPFSRPTLGQVQALNGILTFIGTDAGTISAFTNSNAGFNVTEETDTGQFWCAAVGTQNVNTTAAVPSAWTVAPGASNGITVSFALKEAAGGGGTALDPGAGSVAISGHAPTIAQPKSLAPGAGALALTGFAPTIGQPHSLAPGAVALTLTGHAPTVSQSLSVQPGAGSLALTGYAPSIGQPHGVAPGSGSIAIMGYAPTVTQSGAQSVLPGAGAIVLSGHAPTVTQGTTLPPRLGGFEAGGAREVSFKPLMQRILEARNEKRVKPAKERAAKRAKVIEVQAAQVALEDGGEAQFRALMQQWLAQRPVIPAGSGLEAQLAFMAQVAFRIQQMQAEEQARAVLAAHIDEEEALIALLLA